MANCPRRRACSSWTICTDKRQRSSKRIFASFATRYLLWHLPAGCTDEVQPIDAGYGRLLKVYTGQALDEWLGHGENLQKWECNALTASERRVLITKWVGEATERIDKLPYRHADGRT